MCHFNIRCCWDSLRSVCCVHQRAIWTQSTVKHAIASTGLQEIDTWKAAAAMLTCDLPQGKGLMRHTDCNTNDQPATTLGTSNLLFLMYPETRNQISYCVRPVTVSPLESIRPSVPFQPTATIPVSMVRGPFSSFKKLLQYSAWLSDSAKCCALWLASPKYLYV
jgi:hypothetical protein